MTESGFRTSILRSAAQGALVLTATRRLARQLLEADRQNRTAAGEQVWPKPKIISGQDWWSEQAAQLGEDWRILPMAAARRIWEEVIEDDLATARFGLLQVSAAALLAQQAHQLLTDYAADSDDCALSADHQAFLRWRRAYLARLAEGGWEDPSALPKRILTAVQSGQLRLPQVCLLVGYDEVPPPFRRLAEREVPGVQFRILAPPQTPAGAPLYFSYPDSRSEVRAAAGWARRLLEEGQGRIGIVVPDLGRYRDLIEQVFLEELDPPTLLAMSDDERRFGLSLGTPLAREGVVATALRLLGCGHELESDELGLLLRSPYLSGGEREAEARAQYDVALRRLRRPSLTLDQLLDSGVGSGKFAPPTGFRRILQNLRKSHATRRGTPAHWLKSFRELLVQVGWPGERALGSREYQAITAWEEKLLPAFAALDGICRPLSRQDAVGLLQRLAGEQEFQVESPDPGIQVCGVLEAGGLEFDHLWVLGLHEGAWPPAPRPNPFIPRPLQIELDMPHADAAREARFAKQVLLRLQSAAPRVICSHPLQDEGCRLRPSPLLTMATVTAGEYFPSWLPQQQIFQFAPPLERLCDDRGVPLPAGTAAPGGTAVLRDQALCPFRGFARHRLGARRLEVPGPGLDPATRGTLAHKCLELFWQQVGNQQALLALNPAAMSEVIAASVEAGLDQVLGDTPLAPSPAHLAIEQQRLIRLLEEWVLSVEMARPAGAVTVTTEMSHEAECGGLQLATKIDRLDTLADGRSVILDYKTGQCDLDELLDERLLAPQLPLYALSGGGVDLAGVAIGQLRPGDCSLKGIARDGDLFSRTDAFSQSRAAARYGIDGWAGLLERWHLALDQLGRQTLAGWAAVDPVSRQQACRTCDLAALCRIGEGGDDTDGEAAES